MEALSMTPPAVSMSRIAECGQSSWLGRSHERGVTGHKKTDGSEGEGRCI